MTDSDLIGIAAKIVPLSRTMKEQINHIRAGRSSAPCAPRRIHRRTLRASRGGRRAFSLVSISW